MIFDYEGHLGCRGGHRENEIAGSIAGAIWQELRDDNH